MRLFGASVAARRRTSREQSCMACVQVFFFERLACVQTSCRAVFVFPAHGYTTTALFSGPYLAACRVCARLLYAHERCTYADGEISDLAIRGSFSSEYKRHTPPVPLLVFSYSRTTTIHTWARYALHWFFRSSQDRPSERAEDVVCLMMMIPYS